MIRGNNHAAIHATEDENVVLIFTELRFRGHWTYLIYMHAFRYHQMARHCVATNASRFNLPPLEQTWKHVRCKHESRKHRSSPYPLKIRCVSFGFFCASQFLASKLFCEFAQRRIHISEYLKNTHTHIEILHNRLSCVLSWLFIMRLLLAGTDVVLRTGPAWVPFHCSMPRQSACTFIGQLNEFLLDRLSFFSIFLTSFLQR